MEVFTLPIERVNTLPYYDLCGTETLAPNQNLVIFEYKVSFLAICCIEKITCGLRLVLHRALAL